MEPSLFPLYGFVSQHSSGTLGSRFCKKSVSGCSVVSPIGFCHRYPLLIFSFYLGLSMVLSVQRKLTNLILQLIPHFLPWLSLHLSIELLVWLLFTSRVAVKGCLSSQLPVKHWLLSLFILIPILVHS